MKSIVHKLLIVFLIGLFYIPGYSQTIIQMEEYGGVYRIPCKVNGAKMKLIFDTGADKVCISLSMADYLYDNDYITKDDIIGIGSSTVADGSIVDHIKINIRDIEIQGIHIKNVEAVVIDGQNAPLLLGQSAIKKLGKYSISGNKLIISNSNSSSQTKAPLLSKAEIEKLMKEANNAYKDEAYYVAIDKYLKLHNNNLLPIREKLRYANCCLKTSKDNDALAVCQSIQEEEEIISKSNKAELYWIMGICYTRMNNDDKAVECIEKCRYYAESWSERQLEAVVWLSVNYRLNNDYIHAKLVIEEYISKYLSFKNYKPTDCWEKNFRDEFLGGLYFFLYDAYESGPEDEKYLIISAAWGDKESIKLCDEIDINYLSKKNINKYTY